MGGIFGQPRPGPLAGRQIVGRRGEDCAAAYLERQGYAIIARNWRTRRGELDIVARDGEWLVFVEVRARQGGRRPTGPILGAPEDSVTSTKQRQLAAMVEEYLFQAPWDGPKRIDVVAVELAADGALQRLTHYRDAVEGLL